MSQTHPQSPPAAAPAIGEERKAKMTTAEKMLACGADVIEVPCDFPPAPASPAPPGGEGIPEHDPVEVIVRRWSSLDCFIFSKRYPDSWIDDAKRDIPNLIAWLRTEREMHAAWRKRAEEAERPNRQTDKMLSGAVSIAEHQEKRADLLEAELATLRRELADTRQRERRLIEAVQGRASSSRCECITGFTCLACGLLMDLKGLTASRAAAEGEERR